ncbi:glycosyltransferase family 2 protein [Faecalicoccus pleomorphus]|uniref:glycosyltransferase family 2 protein n=1 Tax=Faecalicoccus pleomorphus TaxID=1323 RepID=UPI0025A45E2E|nr:glycosyltransferase family 2 protein [Faecalicoccus pleomorphus]MDM8293384.1 glycosyltransferase family 2 protein [Faecalicoccus pleomorphus]
MSENYNYSIDRVKYKKLPGKCYIEILGWCIAKGQSNVDYLASINNQNVPLEVVKYKRDDLRLAFKKKGIILKESQGFRILVPCEDKSINNFILYAIAEGKDKQKLYTATANQLLQIENDSMIEYNIDSFEIDEEKSMATACGWAFSLQNEEVRFSIENSRNETVDSTLQINLRSDLLEMKMIDNSQKFCGFRISFPYDKKDSYNIRFTSDSYQTKQHLSVARHSKLALFHAYLNELNGENISKATKYLKENGLKKFISRLKFGPNTNSMTYQDWFLGQRITEEELQKQAQVKFSHAPKISIIVATFNTKENYLKEMIDTVVHQSYSNWELCIADGSNTDNVIHYIEKNYPDNRIKWTKLDQNYGISGNMNKALELATGDYVGLYDHDDMLELDALYEVVKSIQDYPYDLIYTDEDKFDDSKKEFVDPNFKPDYSPDLFRSHNYITHFFVVNKRIIDQVGGMRSEFDGAQDYDFMFRCIEKANGIYHIPKILYHWRMHPLSTAQNPESKLYCYEAGKKAIEEHYKRIGVEATVEMMPKPMWGMYHTTYSTKDDPLVSIIIPNMNHKNILETCVNSLYNVNTYKNFEIIIIENNSTEQDIFDYYEQIQLEHDNVRVVTWDKEFNYSSINNYGVEYAKGDYLLFLNNDTEMITKDALSEMLGCCMRPEVGAVGAKLLYKDDTVQHAGVVIGFGGYAGHVFNGIDKDDYGYMVRARINCNYSAVTAACMMVKNSVFNDVGGFDEQFKVACNDVDLCLKIRKTGKLIVYDAFSLWHHYESKSRGYEDNQEKIWRFNNEVEKFQKKWPDILKNGDPYYNKNFKIEHGPFSLF